DGAAVVVAGQELHAFPLRIRDQGAREREQRVVGGRDLVEVAVTAYERQQFAQVLLADAVDPHQSSSCSSPSVSPGGSVASRSSASRTPGMYASRENAS